ncbi:MAG: DUF4234 domain-containing protein [Nocardioidaceae bacterium]
MTQLPYDHPEAFATAPAQGHAAPPVPAGYSEQPMQYGYVPAAGPVGRTRDTGVCILLAFVTLGIYPLVWFYQVHTEMKRHSNDGLGGGVAVLLALFVGIVMPYLTSAEIGGMYRRRGLHEPVGGATGLWYFPGAILLVGPLVWFVKTNGALNAYWRSLGAR